MNKCFECGGECCKSVAIRLDPPREASDYEDFKWYLFHDKFIVFCDEEGDWHVDVAIPCRLLTKDGKCSIYKTRPPVCRDYDSDGCDESDADDKTIYLYTPEDVDNYVDKLRKEGKLTRD